MTITTRPATRADLPAIVRLLADDELGGGRERPADPLPQAYFDAFDAISRQSGNQVLVADENGRVVGCLQLILLPTLATMGTTRAQIEGVRVASNRRGQGIGAQLLADAIAIARGNGAAIMQLTSNRSRKAAQRFYARLGFVESHVGMKLDLI